MEEEKKTRMDFLLWYNEIGKMKGQVTNVQIANWWSERMFQTKWHIWSIEHQSWWAPDEKGYVAKKEHAGIYRYEDACRIVRGANISEFEVPNEAMIRVK